VDDVHEEHALGFRELWRFRSRKSAMAAPPAIRSGSTTWRTGTRTGVARRSKETPPRRGVSRLLPLFFTLIGGIVLCVPQEARSPIRFALQGIPFRLESDETLIRHVPATMAGGVAVFDYNRDGRPDIFFTNGANIQTLVKDFPKFSKLTGCSATMARASSRMSRNRRGCRNRL